MGLSPIGVTTSAAAPSPSDQYIALVDTETGEYGERRLNHSDGEAEKFYREQSQENSQRLQELDDGFLVIPLQLFKLLTYVVCFAMVAQNCVVKRQRSPVVHQSRT